MPKEKQCYPWATLPGSGNGFIRFGNGRAVCAVLKPELNPKAPEVILVGEGPLRERWAQIICDQNHKLPFEVYVKRGRNQWEYSGKFVVQGFDDSPVEIRRHEQTTQPRRQDVVRVIYLRKTA
jgi:hypothetical protein